MAATAEDQNGGDAGWNLLLGLTAVQLNLVSKSQFVAAAAAWAGDRERPLGQRLVEQGALSPDSLALLRPLVEQYVRENGPAAEDAMASLAAGNSSVDFALDEAAALDADVAATRDRMAATRPASGENGAGGGGPGGPGEAETVVPSAAAGGAGRFSVVRFHARGGLGEVFVAEDRELNRHVALKEIQPRYAGQEESRSRFRLEAEVTGRLEHPNIVPVYGLGQYADGRPYYAMRLVEGESLADRAAAFHETRPRPGRRDFRSLEFRGLLGRFVDVCQAVEYAHSRGILHRDLKPGNVMLGRHGETLVVDWGLAKAVGRDAAPQPDAEETLRPSSGESGSHTTPGQAIGTPAYMSPEAARGDVEATGKPSDVYSLGATLAHLLTGSPAVGLGPGIRERVLAGDLTAPRAANPSVPRALEAIALKAMSAEPSARYASAAAVAEDVERWLADEPVAALPEPLAARAGRLARRHATEIAAAAAVAVVALVGLSSLSAALAQSNTDLRAAVARAEGSEDRSRRAAVILSRYANKGLVGGLSADERETLFREAYESNAWLLAGEPDATRKADLEFEQADLARRYGFILKARRKYADARPLLEESVAAHRRLHRADGPARRRMGYALYDLGMLEKATADNASAEPLFKEAAAAFEAAGADDAADPRAAGRVLQEMSDLHRAAGEHADALADAEAAAAEFDRLVGTDGQTDEDLYMWLLARTRTVTALWRLGRADESAAAFESAAAKGRRWQEETQSPIVRKFYGKLLLARCAVLSEERPAPEALAALSAEAERIFGMLAGRRPGDFYHGRDLAVARTFAAMAAGDADAAEKLDAAVAHLSAVVGKDYPGLIRHHLATAYRVRADLADDPAGWEAGMAEAVRLQRDAVEANADYAPFRDRLALYKAWRAGGPPRGAAGP